MHLKFWGVRGSIPVPGKQTVKYGGNTTCVEVRIGDQLCILDAGSGIRPLGYEIIKDKPMKMHLFLSHVHWDHIQGFPFFLPALLKDYIINIYGMSNTDSSLGEILSGQMEGPHFPLSIKQMGSKIVFHGLEENSTIKIRDKKRKIVAKVQSIPLNHPNGSIGYKITDLILKRSIVFATDTEHYEDKIDEGLLEHSKESDVLIYDGQYTVDEYNGNGKNFSRKGWGHSTWKKGLEIAEKAKVKRLIITHHDPVHSDTFINKLSVKANAFAKEKNIKVKIEWAYEGMSIKLS